jgi:hypothetical protein
MKAKSGAPHAASIFIHVIDRGESAGVFPEAAQVGWFGWCGFEARDMSTR